MTTITPDPADPRRRAAGLRRAFVNASIVANNPELAYPDMPEHELPDLGEQEAAAELAYYTYLDAHRAELADCREFAVEYGVLDERAARGLPLSAMATETGDPEADYYRHEHDRRRGR